MVDNDVRPQRRVAAAALVGTTVEWYDFFIYAQAAALVFSPLFFQPAGPRIAILISFASVGLSFLFRPLGAFLAGHLGDRLGRKRMMVATLILMGVATTGIGLLPTYAAAGVLAPVLLLLLRILQGVSAGGEWGGAALMAVEHAPARRRGLAGSAPQLGVPLGLLLATGVMALMTGIVAPGEAFLAWGWRVPFLLSVALIVVGYVVRHSVDESPVFRELHASGRRQSVPLVALFRENRRLVLLAALVFAGNNAAGQMTSGGFLSSYATDPVGMDRTTVLLAIVFGSAVMLITTLAGGVLSDRIGRRRTYLLGYTVLGLSIFPLFWLTDTAEPRNLLIGLLLLNIGLGLAYGPQAAWYAELFPASVRYSGVSVSYALGAVLGGAFASLISTFLVQQTGTVVSVAVYLVIMVVISVVAVLALPDRPDESLFSLDDVQQPAG